VAAEKAIRYNARAPNAENGVLVAFDVAKQTRRKSTIKVEKDSYVFLR